MTPAPFLCRRHVILISVSSGHTLDRNHSRRSLPKLSTPYEDPIPYYAIHRRLSIRHCPRLTWLPIPHYERRTCRAACLFQTDSSLVGTRRRREKTLEGIPGESVPSVSPYIYPENVAVSSRAWDTRLALYCWHFGRESVEFWQQRVCCTTM